MLRVRSVVALEDFSVRITFTDGSLKVVDLSPFLEGAIFEPLRNDPNLWRKLRVDDELGTVTWPNGADICPDVLSGRRMSAKAEEAASRRAKT
jgi:uncharacterized protein DUF2442